MLEELVPPERVADYAMRFDMELLVSVLMMGAEIAQEYFTARLHELFPDARVINHVSDMTKDERIALLIAPLKARCVHAAGNLIQ